VASVPNRIYFGDDFLGRLLALAQRDPHHSQKPLERIYTNVARSSPHQFRVVSPTRSKSVALICIRLLFARPETDPAIYTESIHPVRIFGFLFSLFRKQQQQNCLRRQVRFSVAILILIPLVKLNEKFKRDTRGDKRELARLGWNRKKKKSRTIGCHRLAPFHLTAVKPQKKKKKSFFPSSVYTEFIHWSVLCTYG
jgi:hypothetical protein